MSIALLDVELVDSRLDYYEERSGQNLVHCLSGKVNSYRCCASICIVVKTILLYDASGRSLVAPATLMLNMSKVGLGSFSCLGLFCLVHLLGSVSTHVCQYTDYMADFSRGSVIQRACCLNLGTELSQLKLSCVPALRCFNKNRFMETALNTFKFMQSGPRLLHGPQV